MEVVKALADNDMVVIAAARATFYSNSSYRYQMERIYACTGLNPLKFYDLQKLLLMEVEG